MPLVSQFIYCHIILCLPVGNYHMVGKFRRVHIFADTIVQEIFGIKNFSNVQWCPSIKYSKYVLHRIIIAAKFFTVSTKSRKRTRAGTCAHCMAPRGTQRKCHHMYLQWSLLDAMSILTFFKSKDAPTNPKGPLLLSIPSKAIALANCEFAKATSTGKTKK